MPENMIDYPAEDIHWFSGEKPQKVIGDCPHASCPHTATSVIAWGPSFEFYELITCDIDDGCNGQCRGWLAVAGDRDHGQYSKVKWRQCAS